MKNWRENLDFDKEQAAQMYWQLLFSSSKWFALLIPWYVQEANDRTENEHAHFRQALSFVLLYSYSKLGFLIVLFRIKKRRYPFQIHSLTFSRELGHLWQFSSLSSDLRNTISRQIYLSSSNDNISPWLKTACFKQRLFYHILHENRRSNLSIIRK